MLRSFTLVTVMIQSSVPDAGLLSSIGFVISTGLLHATGIAIGLAHRWPAGQRALRLAGFGIAIAGVWFTWQALA